MPLRRRSVTRSRLALRRSRWKAMCWVRPLMKMEGSTALWPVESVSTGRSSMLSVPFRSRSTRMHIDTIMLRSWGSTRAERTLILLSLASAATNRSPMAGIGAAWTAPVVAAPIRAAISEW